MKNGFRVVKTMLPLVGMDINFPRRSRNRSRLAIAQFLSKICAAALAAAIATNTTITNSSEYINKYVIRSCYITTVTQHNRSWPHVSLAAQPSSPLADCQQQLANPDFGK